MVKIPGTNVASGITPFSTEDRFPTHYSKYGKGGWRFAENILERNRIPMERREEGMVVYVKSENTHYTLIGGIDDDDWEELQIGKTKLNTPYVLNENKKVWVISHNLGRFPAVTIFDRYNNIIIADIDYNDPEGNELTITFSAYPGLGTKAYLS